MLMPSHHWANTFAVTDEDIEFLAGLLLEGEKPLTTDELTRALVERRLAQESDSLKARFRDGVKAAARILAGQGIDCRGILDIRDADTLKEIEETLAKLPAPPTEDEGAREEDELCASCRGKGWFSPHGKPTVHHGSPNRRCLDCGGTGRRAPASSKEGGRHG